MRRVLILENRLDISLQPSHDNARSTSLVFEVKVS